MSDRPHEPPASEESEAEPFVGLDDGSMQGLFALAVRLYSNQMYEQSACIMEYLLRHDPARPHYHRALGKALHAQGRHEQAVNAYARAARLGLPDPDVHYYIGQCLAFMRRYDLAAQALERCLQLAASQRAKFAHLIECAQGLRTAVERAAARSAPSSQSSGR